MLFQRLRSERARSKAQNQAAARSGNGDKEGALMYWDRTALLVGVVLFPKQGRLGMGLHFHFIPSLSGASPLPGCSLWRTSLPCRDAGTGEHH